MRKAPFTKSLARIAAVATVVVVAVTMAGSPSSQFTTKDKAFYADSNTVAFVRPGLSIKVTAADIAADGTIKTTVSIADPKGVPLDQAGATTPGPVSLSCTVAVLPNGSNDFVSYTPIAPTENWFDSGGVWAPVSAGVYTYTFKTKAPSGFDITASHRAGCTGIRDLSEFGLSTYYASATLDFVPGGKPATQVHDIIRTAACNSCHANLAYHGGNANGVNMCVLCHTKAASEPQSGNSLYFPVLIHKVHMGQDLPSVKAGKPYQIFGYMNAVSDFSTVAFPSPSPTSDAGRCYMCHDPNSGAAQANNYLKPNRAACGACHDNVNFATGQNHANQPQPDDKQCANCHTPQGELPFDISILGAHNNINDLIPARQDFIPGMIFDNLTVANGKAGNKPTITFTLRDKAGNAISLNELKVSPGRLAAVMGGPTSDYGYTNFGADVTTTHGYVSEDVTASGNCDSNGNCSYTFLHAVPAGATGTYVIGLEGRRGVTILPGTTVAMSTEYGADNKVAYFSVDGSTVAPRRKVVDLAKCNACHTALSLHGTNRNQIEMCVICHNPSETDIATRGQSTIPAEKAKPPQAVNFSYMIHHIHGGEDIKNYTGVGYSVIGFGGSFNDFSDVRYPVMRTDGTTGNIGNCAMCHVNNSEGKLPEGLNNVTIPQSPLNPTPAATAACTSCHANKDPLSHAVANTTQFGESCSVCHGAGAEFAVDKVHAQ